MSYNNTIIKNVRKAFKLVGDLAVDVKLVASKPLEFDFNEVESITTSKTSSTLKGIVNDKRRTPITKYQEGSAIVSTILLKSEDVSNLTEYDALTIDGIVWNISSFSDDSYVTTVTIVRNG